MIFKVQYSKVQASKSQISKFQIPKFEVSKVEISEDKIPKVQTAKSPLGRFQEGAKSEEQKPRSDFSCGAGFLHLHGAAFAFASRRFCVCRKWAAVCAARHRRALATLGWRMRARFCMYTQTHWGFKSDFLLRGHPFDKF